MATEKQMIMGLLSIWMQKDDSNNNRSSSSTKSNNLPKLCKQHIVKFKMDRRETPCTE